MVPTAALAPVRKHFDQDPRSPGASRRPPDSDGPGASRRSPEASGRHEAPRARSSSAPRKNLRLLLIAYPSSNGGIHLKRLSDFPGPLSSHQIASPPHCERSPIQQLEQLVHEDLPNKVVSSMADASFNPAHSLNHFLSTLGNPLFDSVYAGPALVPRVWASWPRSAPTGSSPGSTRRSLGWDSGVPLLSSLCCLRLISATGRVDATGLVCCVPVRVPVCARPELRRLTRLASRAGGRGRSGLLPADWRNLDRAKGGSVKLMAAPFPAGQRVIAGYQFGWSGGLLAAAGDEARRLRKRAIGGRATTGPWQGGPSRLKAEGGPEGPCLPARGQIHRFRPRPGARALRRRVAAAPLIAVGRRSDPTPGRLPGAVSSRRARSGGCCLV